MKGRACLMAGSAALVTTLVSATLVTLPAEKPPPFSPVVRSTAGHLLSAGPAADEQWRFRPESATVPFRFRTALLTYEDKRFFRHPGVDPLAMARALWSNLQAGRIVSGGSTLTMQLVRLTRPELRKRRSLLAKVQQMMLALAFDLRLSGKEILHEYAMRAPMGGNTVGLTTAARRYFRRSPEQLNWAESALLAVLPNRPSLLRGRGRAVLLEKRNRLLRRLQQAGHLSRTDLQLALTEPLPGPPPSLRSPAFHLLAANPGRTTLRRPLQQAVGALARREQAALMGRGIHNLSLLIIDNRQQQVVAMVGNAALWTRGGRHGWVDVVHAPRSTGSLLKPLLYGAMLDAGQLTPATLVPDVPGYFRGFSPRNYDRKFRGAVPAARALATSLNVPAVYMLRDYGYPRFHALLRRAGLHGLNRSADHYGLSLILGGGEASLLQLTRLYAALARRAQSDEPVPALQWVQPAPAGAFPLSRGAAWLTLQALLEVGRPAEEKNWRSFRGSRRVAWKTGTSYGLRDGWAIGVTPEYTVGVWTGNATGEGVPGLTGIDAAAPVLFRTLQLLPPTNWFDKPVDDLDQVEVCHADGYRPVSGW